jgi:MFS family permease
MSLMTTPLITSSPSRGLWAIGWMSFFWSTGTLMVTGLLPVFLTEVLHASHTDVGILEGVAVAAMFASKIVSGVLSDIFRTRKPLIAIGSLFTILVKLLFAAATSFNYIFLAKCIDRLSRGIRASPTDALIADLSTKTTLGKSYGIRQTFYPLGATFGSILATGLMIGTANNYRTIFLLATIPGILALLTLVFFIRQPLIPHETPTQKAQWKIQDIRFLPRQFWLFLGIATLLMFARFSEAFLTLRAKSVGWDIAMLPLLMVGYELVHASIAYPMGKLADRMNRKVMLLIGISLLFLTNLILMSVSSWGGVLIGTLVCGLHMGMTQGLLSTMVAESTPADLRGTAFALYYLCIGGAVLIGNFVAGRLADTFGIQGAFYGGAVFTCLAALALLTLILSQK